MASLEGSIQIWSQTAADWTTLNPVLLQGQMGLETDTRRKKTGDGSTAWNDLEYDSTGGGNYPPTYATKKYTYPHMSETESTGFGGPTEIDLFMPIDEDHNVTAMEVNISTGHASRIRLGIRENVDGYPGDIVVQSGDISVASTGIKTFTFASPVAVSGKGYFACIIVESGSTGFTIAQGIVALLPHPGGTNLSQQYRYGTGVFGDFAASYPGGQLPVSGWGVLPVMTRE